MQVAASNSVTVWFAWPQTTTYKSSHLRFVCASWQRFEKRTSPVGLGRNLVVSQRGAATQGETETVNEALAPMSQWQIKTGLKIEPLRRFFSGRKAQRPDQL